MAQADERAVEAWLVRLATLAASGSLSVDDLQAKVRGYVPFLAAGFDAEAFNLRSLEAVAAQCQFFPAYGELVPLLKDWWRENRHSSATPALEGSGPRLSTEDQQWLAFWHRRVAESFGATANHPAGSRETVLGLIRQQSPRAYAAITGKAEPSRSSPDAAAALAASQSVAAAMRAMRERHPGHFDSPPSESPASPPEPPLPDVAHKGELLRQRREARGLVVPFVAPPPPVDEGALPTLEYEAAE